VSTIVLAIQTESGGVTPALAPPTPGSEGTVTDWVKKQVKTLAGWLKTLAEKATAALPGARGSSRLRAQLLFGLRNTCGQRFSLWSPRLRFIIARGSRLWQSLLPRR